MSQRTWSRSSLATRLKTIADRNRCRRALREMNRSIPDQTTVSARIQLPHSLILDAGVAASLSSPTRHKTHPKLSACSRPDSRCRSGLHCREYLYSSRECRRASRAVRGGLDIVERLLQLSSGDWLAGADPASVVSRQRAKRGEAEQAQQGEAKQRELLQALHDYHRRSSPAGSLRDLAAPARSL